MSNFDKYIRQGEPDRKAKAQAWQTAIGLQDVDGLKPSEYLLQTAGRHIEGDITIDEVKHLIDSYYQSKTNRNGIENERTEEADKVSARITEILSEKSFSFTPDYLTLIHRRLFEGLYRFAGRLRDYDITKKEWVLDGDTVLYSNHELIRQTLEYDFGQEKSVDYPSLDANQALRHICKFVSDIWQIHPFGEGNTRTTAVFTMKYLHTFGFTLDNSVFQEHSWYFRNALVRANYNNYAKGISATTSFLELFFRNLLFGEKNELHNRALHIAALQSANSNDSKSQTDTLNCTLDEIELTKEQNFYPDITFWDKEGNLFAVDLKSSYRKTATHINGMTLGAFTGYFRERKNQKNITHPYEEYKAHIVLGVIYTPAEDVDERRIYTLEQLEDITSVVKDFDFFVQEKWKIASDRPGSGNTKNIGSITLVEDLKSGNGPFASLGEDVFDDYWTHYLTKDMAKAAELPEPYYSNLPEYKQFKKLP